MKHKKKLNAFIDDYNNGTPWQIVAESIERELEQEQAE